MGYKRETVELLKQFRKNMGSEFFQEDSKRLFKSTLTELPKQEINPISEMKLQYAKSYFKSLLVFNLVKFIGVSGSVAAGTSKEEDDIDFFVVVKNNTMWIYRGLMLMKNIFNPRMRKAKHEHMENTNLLCVNLIAEERGLKFDNDIFNLHELYYLKPVYNPEYFDVIISENQWIKEWGGVVPKQSPLLKKTNVLVESFNLYFFLAQLLYMSISRHKYDVKRLFRNYMKGRMEFFKDEYKKEKLSLLK